MSNFYSQTFPTGENPFIDCGRIVGGATLGVLWHDMQTAVGKVYGTQDGTAAFNDSIGVLTGSWGTTQRARGVASISTPIASPAAGFEEIELLLHFTVTPSNTTGYEFTLSNHSSGSYTQINRWNSGLGSFTLLNGDATQITTGDVITATAIGSPHPVLTLYRNGAVLLTYDTATGNDGGTPGSPDSVFFTGGAPGVGHYNEWTGHGDLSARNVNYGWSSFEATDGFLFADFIQGVGQEIGSSGAVVTKAYASDVSVSSLLIAGTYMAGTAGTCVVTDSQGNKWTTSATSTNATDGHQIFLSWAIAKRGGPNTVTTTVTGNTATTFMGLSIAEYAAGNIGFDGVPLASPLPIDQLHTATGNSTAASSGATATTTFANELCVGVFGGANSSGTNPTGTNGYNVRVNVQNTAKWQTSVADKVIFVTGAQTATATIPTQQWSAIIGTFAQSLTPLLNITTPVDTVAKQLRY